MDFSKAIRIDKKALNILFYKLISLCKFKINYVHLKNLLNLKIFLQRIRAATNVAINGGKCLII